MRLPSQSKYLIFTGAIPVESQRSKSEKRYQNPLSKAIWLHVSGCPRNQSTKNGPLPFQCFNKRMWRRKDRTCKCNECISYVNRAADDTNTFHWLPMGKAWEQAAVYKKCCKFDFDSEHRNWTLRRCTCRQTLADTNFLIGNRNNRRIVAATGKFAIFLWQYINLAQGIFLLSF